MGWDPGLGGAFRFPAGPVRAGLKPLFLAPSAHSPGVTSWTAPARVTRAETCVSSCPGEQLLLDECLAPESCRVQSLLSHQDFHDGGGVLLSPVTLLAKWEIILDPVPPHTPIFSHPPSLVHRFCFLRALQCVCVLCLHCCPGSCCSSSGTCSAPSWLDQHLHSAALAVVRLAFPQWGADPLTTLQKHHSAALLSLQKQFKWLTRPTHTPDWYRFQPRSVPPCFSCCWKPSRDSCSQVPFTW